MRRLLWERDGKRTGTIRTDYGDLIRWIHTSVMIADPLTKVMKPDVLLEAMHTSYFNLVPSADSVARKAAKKKQKQQPTATLDLGMVGSRQNICPFPP